MIILNVLNKAYLSPDKIINFFVNSNEKADGDEALKNNLSGKYTISNNGVIELNTKNASVISQYKKDIRKLKTKG